MMPVRLWGDPRIFIFPQLLKIAFSTIFLSGLIALIPFALWLQLVDDAGSPWGDPCIFIFPQLLKIAFSTIFLSGLIALIPFALWLQLIDDAGSPLGRPLHFYFPSAFENYIFNASGK